VAVPTLREMQGAMRRGLIDGGDQAAAAILADALLPADRLSIYRNTSRATLTKALRLNFPAVERLVGEDFFAAAADEFITREPPQSAWLDLYGESFPAFLQGFAPAATLVYLADTARLERAVGRALHAPDLEPLDIARLESVDASQQPRVCFVPHPSVSLLASPYPVDAIWRAVLARDDAALAAIDLSSGAVRLLVERGPHQVEVTRLDQARWTFAEPLFGGKPLSAALEAAGDPNAAGFLAEHLTTGRFTDFGLDTAPRREGADS
jgi:Putative DNA-binding domain